MTIDEQIEFINGIIQKLVVGAPNRDKFVDVLKSLKEYRLKLLLINCVEAFVEGLPDE